MSNNIGCPHAFKTMYIEQVEDNYIVKPCCRLDVYEKAKNIDQIKNHEFLLNLRDEFIKRRIPAVCNSCTQKENLGLSSKRLDALNHEMFIETEYLIDEQSMVHHNMIDWDIRPDNICNLKCVMCSPLQSSKWNEDIEIYQKYFQYPLQKRNSIDWTYVLNNVKNKAKRIYIAGGEPFYSKPTLKFLKELSDHSWNRKNTELCIQTNGVSLNENLIETLSRFEKIEFNMSLDGTEHVNHIIRYPTDWKLFLNNYRELSKISCKAKMDFSTTVSALNLPDIDDMLSLFPEDTFHLNRLEFPRILKIDALKTSVIEKVLSTTKNMFVKDLCENHIYDNDANEKMKKYLLDLDHKRKTNSEKYLPWCFI